MHQSVWALHGAAAPRSKIQKARPKVDAERLGSAIGLRGGAIGERGAGAEGLGSAIGPLGGGIGARGSAIERLGSAIEARGGGIGRRNGRSEGREGGCEGCRRH